MAERSETAVANANIAFIKYWGNRDDRLRLPSNGSISMNLAGLQARTTVQFDPVLSEDTLEFNGKAMHGKGLERVRAFLDEVRRIFAEKSSQRGSAQPLNALHAQVISENNFPTGAGIASSAAAFAALSLAATRAIGLSLSEIELSRLARLGSGSACRSIPSGFVELQAGPSEQDSYAVSIAPPDHWDLVDCIAIVNAGIKPVGSSEGHIMAGTSTLQSARIADTPRRLDICRNAVLSRDFSALAAIIEEDSNLMHAVMLTSRPALMYWLPATITIMRSIQRWRKDGLPVAYTIDAGPNVHAICQAASAPEVENRLRRLPGVHKVLTAHPGGAAFLENRPEQI
jgi:diphosphomevalonate decarboxylase